LRAFVYTDMKFNKDTFFDKFRPFYKQKTGKRTLAEQTVGAVDFLLDQFSNTPAWKDIRQVAYAFATIAHETAWTFMPIMEYRAKAGTKGRANQDRYWLSGFQGRGYVQLTWERNYKKATEKLGVDFVHNPALALRQDLAFKILTFGMQEGWFTGKKLSDYINAHEKEYKEARRVINGQDKAPLIASYAESFEVMLKESLSSGNDLIQHTGDSQPTDDNVSDENPQEFDDEGNPIDSSPIQPVDGYPEAPKPGEPATPESGLPGTPIAGGRPGDPPKEVPAVEPTPTSGWGTWISNIRAQITSLGIGGISLSAIFTGLVSNPIYVYVLLGVVLLAVIISTTIYITSMVIKSKDKRIREQQAHELTLKQLELNADPSKYNVVVTK
jgi:hypothetical protein